MFESVKMAPTDPVLGLSDLYKSDKKRNKVNLGIGVYKNKNNKIAPVLTSVQKAERWLLENESSKNYLKIEGNERFSSATQSLLFSSYENFTELQQRMITVQALGGTGALRIAAEFLARNFTTKRKVWISDPSWINHKNIFLASGLEICNYPYYNYYSHILDFENLLDCLHKANPGDAIIIHCCCHNPTGLDPDFNQWKILSKFLEEKKILPIFDLAYQGFAIGLKDDLLGLHTLCKNNSEMIICNSYSKNFGLYNERVGACTVLTNNNTHAKNVLSQLNSIIRANYSSPPNHGASIISLILKDKKLRFVWEKELEEMRIHIHTMRSILQYKLESYNLDYDFSFINKQRGMFAFMGLNSNQVSILKEKFGIYLVGSGRINISGLSTNNVDYVCQSIANIYR